MSRSLCCCVLLMVLSSVLTAHEMRPAYLELRQTAADVYDVIWKVPASGADLRLALYVRLPDGCTNLSEPRGMVAGGAYLERWKISAPRGLSGRITIDGLSATATDVLIRVERLDGSSQVSRVLPSNPSLLLTDAPRSLDVARTYIVLGVEHILLGVDHLLFVLGLLLIVDGRMMLLKTITSFTLAHSLTLAIATLGYASAPLPPLNASIALSILFLGPEIVRKWRGETSLTIRRPWIVAFAFGLLHGFGFASGLSTAGMAPTAIPQALLWFNVGVEMGQLLFVGVVLSMILAFRILQMRWPVWAERLPGYVVGVSGAYWTIQRTLMLFARWG